ncbi:hypothetical protein HPC49_16815 [Pyxidicoccus fallax]|uniref:Uncharacterized protein n=1 Tax=Pyxidicoccus fallax TaxID=394095 RepID=A0A848LCZ4_9BACT|nr:hypothetical protein [Pyxidicoccus fallax]NMO16557.1 hypothetical protein [Pyxidicoccus fallax]NPC79879.1 hypothetical protein [Pyxidicoccus fallax]
MGLRANASDPDSGTVTHRWSVSKRPPNSTAQLTNAFSATPSIAFSSSRDIGTWEFRLEVDDDEGEMKTFTVGFTVPNAKPRIELTGPTQIQAGEPIKLSTSVTQDDDGGALQFHWEAIQAPASAGLSMPATLSQTATLDVAPATAQPGTWVFRLTATDDEGESVTRQRTVLVDGKAVASITPPPATWRQGDGVLRIDGTPSTDPDTPCPDVPMGCHVTAGQPLSLSGGLTYEWWAASEDNNWPLTRVSTIFPGALDFNAELAFISHLPQDGRWTFELRVRDAEGNEARQSVSVSVLLGYTFPQARASAVPTGTVVDVYQRVVVQDIWLNGSQSRDIDNGTKWDPAPAGAGIAEYRWTAIPPTLGCPAPQLPQGSLVPLFPAGTVIPPACQGVWTIRLTVVDDDPTPQTASTDIQVTVGNCVDLVCLDGPSPLFPATIYADQSQGALIGFHVDSTLYDLPAVAEGGFVRMGILPAGTTSVFYLQDVAFVQQSGRGQVLLTSWNGRSNGGVRGSGSYDLVLSLFDRNGSLVASRAWPRVINVESASATVASSSDTHLRREAVAHTPGAQATFHVDVSGTFRAVDEVRWRVTSASGTIVNSGTVPGTSATRQVVTWNGRHSNGTGAAAAGAYSLNVDCVRNGVTIASTPAYRFYVYSMVLDPVIAAPSQPGTPGWVHVEGAPTSVAVTSGNFASARLRMVPVRLRLSPAEAGGTVSLSVADPTVDPRGTAASIELFEDTTTATPVSRPRSWSVDGTTAGNGVRLLAYGNGPTGDALVKLAYVVGGRTLAEDTVRYQVARPAATAGVDAPAAPPYFRPALTFNTGTPVNAVFDSRTHTERRGAMARVYVVAHRTHAQWAANPALVDVGGGVRMVGLGTGAGGVDITPLSSTLAPGEYDLVYDFGSFSRGSGAFVPDDRLDPGDVLVSPRGGPAVIVKGSYATGGPFAVQTFEYGTAPGPSTVTVPHGWDGLNAPGGHGFRLRGRVAHPGDMSVSRPLVVFVHGNHTPLHLGPLPLKRVSASVTSDENYRGYAYLQDHLASRGYVTLSVDLDEMSGAGTPYPDVADPGILVRSWVTLKNIEHLVSRAGTLGTGSLSGRIDTNRIYLVGHSRGGEAVHVMLAQLKHLEGIATAAGIVPSGATTIPGLRSAGIKGIVSIAPVTSALDSFKYEETTVPFLLLYGSADGDVHGARADVAPFRHYDRSKANRFALRLIGGNHNAFNTSWGYSDASEQLSCVGRTGPCNLFTAGKMSVPVPVNPAAQLVSAADQRAVATAYLTAFLSAVDGADRGALEYFLEPPSHLRPLGVSATLRLYSQSQLRVGATLQTIDDYESFNSSTDLGVSSSGQPVAFSVTGVNEPLLLDPAERFFNDTRGVVFSWGGVASYDQDLAPTGRNLRWAHSINLRVAQRPALGGSTTSSFQLEVEDASGRRQAVSSHLAEPVSEVFPAVVYKNFQLSPIDGRTNPLASPIDTTSAAFQTYRFPVGAFDVAGVDIGNIARVRMRLGEPGEAPSGDFAVDDVEVEFQ